MDSQTRQGASKCQGLCKAWTSPGVFQKVGGRPKKGIVMYQYYIYSHENEKGEVTTEMAAKTSERVLILQNTSDVDVAIDNFMKEICNSQCKCTACFDILRRTSEMIKDVHTVKKHEIHGICDHCKRHTNRYCNKCIKCNEAIRSFMNRQALGHDTEQETRLHSWFRKVRTLLCALLNRNKHPGIAACARVCSDMQLNELLELLRSPRSSRAREPDVEELLSGNIRRVQSLKNIADDSVSKYYNQLESGRADLGNITGHILEDQKGKRDRSLSSEYVKGGAKPESRQRAGISKSQMKNELKSAVKKEKSAGKSKRSGSASETGHGKSSGNSKSTIKKDKGLKTRDGDKVLVKGSKSNKGEKGSKSKSGEKGPKSKDGETGSKSKVSERGSKSKGEKGSTSNESEKGSKTKSEIRSKSKEGDKKVKDDEKGSKSNKDEKWSKSKAGDNESKFKVGVKGYKSKEGGKGSKSKSGDKGSKSKDDDKGTSIKGIEKGSILKDGDKDSALKEGHEGPKSKVSDKGSQSKAGDKGTGKSKGKDLESEPSLRGKDKHDENMSKMNASKDKKVKDALLALDKFTSKDTSNNIYEKSDTETKLKATPSQILRFREKAAAQCRLIINARKHQARSQLSSYNEEISRKLSITKLPPFGKIYRSFGDISMFSSMKSVDKSEKGLTSTLEKMLNADNLNIQPIRGIEEKAVNNLFYKLIGERKTDKKDAKSEKTVMFGGGDELSADFAYEAKKTQEYEVTKIIRGTKVCKFDRAILRDRDDEGVKPLLFKLEYPANTSRHVSSFGDSSFSEIKRARRIKNSKDAEETPKGVLRYRLSDRQFIEKGWTMLPTEKIVRKMNVYRMRPARPEFDWFDHYKDQCPMLYDTGSRLAEIEEDGRGLWFYRNGTLAMDYYSTEDMNAQQRYVIYSSGEEKLSSAGPNAVLACFDWLGNGVVFDYAGNIRLKYNQTEGVVMDRSLGPVTHWKWHTLNDPPVLQQVMIDTQLTQKDPAILKYNGRAASPQPGPDNEEMLAIEFNNFVKEKSKKLTQTFKPYQIKMKALKINDQFSLRVIDQATVYLIFRDRRNSLKLNLGMKLDPREIVDTDTAELGEVAGALDKYPARTESVARIQRSVAASRKADRSCAERALRVRRVQPRLSVERLRDCLYRPPQLVSTPNFILPH